MVKRVYITLLILAAAAVMIASGCGGGSDVITPSIPGEVNNATPVPEDVNNETVEYGSIVIKVTWPEEEGASPKCIISSGDEEKDITASMPVDTMRVEVKIFDQNDLTKHLDPPGITVMNCSGPGAIDTFTIDSVPLIPVIVRVEAYNALTSGGDFLSLAEVELIMQAGLNSVALNMGSYSLGLSADPAVLKVILPA